MSKSRKSRVQREKAKHRTNMCKWRAEYNARWNRKVKPSTIDEQIKELEAKLGMNQSVNPRGWEIV